MDSLEARIGVRFNDTKVLHAAMTHASYANEHPDEGPDNERLEFLGDAVLDLLVAERLFADSAQLREGEMSRRRALVVKKQGLTRMAGVYALHSYLRLGQGLQESGPTEAMLADAFEALVGAVFLDHGYDTAAKVFGAELDAALQASLSQSDYKTRLQEICHQNGYELPTYETLKVDGPDHARIFTCTVLVHETTYGPASANSKKAAEQCCAQLALEALTND